MPGLRDRLQISRSQVRVLPGAPGQRLAAREIPTRGASRGAIWKPHLTPVTSWRASRSRMKAPMSLVDGRRKASRSPSSRLPRPLPPPNSRRARSIAGCIAAAGVMRGGAQGADRGAAVGVREPRDRMRPRNPDDGEVPDIGEVRVSAGDRRRRDCGGQPASEAPQAGGRREGRQGAGRVVHRRSVGRRYIRRTDGSQTRVSVGVRSSRAQALFEATLRHSTRRATCRRCRCLIRSRTSLRPGEPLERGGGRYTGRNRPSTRSP